MSAHHSPAGRTQGHGYYSSNLCPWLAKDIYLMEKLAKGQVFALLTQHCVHCVSDTNRNIKKKITVFTIQKLLCDLAIMYHSLC